MNYVLESATPMQCMAVWFVGEEYLCMRVDSQTDTTDGPDVPLWYKASEEGWELVTSHQEYTKLETAYLEKEHGNAYH